MLRLNSCSSSCRGQHFTLPVRVLAETYLENDEEGERPRGLQHGREGKHKQQTKCLRGRCEPLVYGLLLSFGRRVISETQTCRLCRGWECTQQ